MMKLPILLISLLLSNSLVLSAPKGPKRSKELTDKTFEHDTQATTGSTTGDWFVKFCTKKSKECKSIEPLWDELAENLYGRVSVAHVDLDKSKIVKQRFNLENIDGPKLWLFKRRKLYQYDGPIDDLDALHKFAIENYDQAVIQSDIPQEATLFVTLWKKMLETIEKAGIELNKYLIKDQKSGEVNYHGIAVFFGIPLIVVFGMCTFMLSSKKKDGRGAIGSKVQSSDKREKKDKLQ